jgi:hypothetical protein
MLAKELGFEIEPDDQEVLEFRDILQQFFSQRPLQSLNPRQVEIGAFFLASMTVPRLPHNMLLWNFLDGAWQYLQQQKKELVAELQQQNHLKFWSSSLEESLLVALREFQRNLNQNK